MPEGNGSDYGVRFDAWRQYFETTARVSTALEAELSERTGLTLSDYNVLLSLMEAPDRCLRMGELASKILFSGSRLNYRIKVHQERGWVTVTADAEDGRSRWVHITPEGSRVFLRAVKVHQRWVSAMFLEEITDEEAEVLTRVFQRVELGLEEL